MPYTALRKEVTMKRSYCIGLTLALLALTVPLAYAADPAKTASATAPKADANAPQVPVVDGIVQPRKPIPQAIADAMQLLRKADGEYKPGNIDGPLAGYFTSCYVQPDGTRSDRNMAFPARQHAYFINTFLLYHDYLAKNGGKGQEEWLQRAKDLADWNLAHSTAPDAHYANLPWSAYDNDKGTPGGSKDRDALEPDKAAFIGTAFLNLYAATKDAKYLDAARAIGKTLAERQGEDGSWPFRVVPQDGTVRQQFGGAPVFFVQFFQALGKHDDDAAFKKAYDKALKLMIERNIEQNLWGTYHEDIVEKPKGYLSAEPMSFTADWLFRNAKENPKFVEMGRKVIERMEENLVHTSGHPAAPAPAVSEQAGFAHMMPGHTSRYCAALTQLHLATGDEAPKRTALSGFNAATYMQNEHGLFATFFQLLNENKPGTKRRDWYSQHLYTVCHMLEAMPHLQELSGNAQ